MHMEKSFYWIPFALLNFCDENPLDTDEFHFKASLMQVKQCFDNAIHCQA